MITQVAAQKMTGADAIKAVLGLEGEAQWIRAWSAVLLLPSQTLDELEAVGANLDSYRPELDSINLALTAYTPNHTNSKGITGGIGSTHLKTLELAHERLTSQMAPGWSEDELAGLLATLARLCEEITAADVSADLKVFLLRQVESMERAIRLYRVTGPEGVVDEAQRVVGATIGPWANSDASSTEHGLLEKLLNVAGKVGRVVEVTAAAIGVATATGAIQLPP